MLRKWSHYPAIALLLMLSGCAAAQVALEHKDLSVQNQMSDTIFLNPVPNYEKTVYVQIRNTSDKNIDLSALPAAIKSHGYRIMSDPQRAHYILQINTLYVGKAAPAAAQETLTAGFGGPLAGVVAGVVDEDVDGAVAGEGALDRGM